MQDFKDLPLSFMQFFSQKTTRERTILKQRGKPQTSKK